MSLVQTGVVEDFAEYIRTVTLREPEVLARLREENGDSSMPISPEQGQFMRLLVSAIGARRTLEVGVYTGYSSISVALGLPDDGKLVACDISAEYTVVARRYWREAGVEHKIELRLGPGVESLDALLAEGQAGSFDFAFIDADKANYDRYYERALQLLRRGGVVALDNVLWHGKVVDPAAQDADTRSIRAINQKIHADERVWPSLIPVSDGLLLAWKR